MIYGKYIVRVERGVDNDEIFIYHSDEELIENTNILIAEFDINTKATDLKSLKLILDGECEFIHLYSKIAG